MHITLFFFLKYGGSVTLCMEIKTTQNDMGAVADTQAVGPSEEGLARGYGRSQDNSGLPCT